MSEGRADRAGALAFLAAQLRAGREAAKCHACGCFQSFVEGLEGTSVREALATDLAESRAAFQPKRYDCLGCAVCFPALAANAFGEAFPEEAAALASCPTEAPPIREGWPPLPGDYRVVRFGAPVAVCTLRSEALASDLAERAPEGLSIAGSLHTENLGIERILRNVAANPNIRFLLLCGEDSQQAVGHLPGQSLQSLFQGGLEPDGRIQGAKGKRPFLANVSQAEVDAFLRQITLVPRIGETDAVLLAGEITRLAAQDPGPFEDAVAPSPVPLVRAEEPRRLVLDPAGYVVVYPDRARRRLRAEHFTNEGLLDGAVEGLTPASVSAALIERGMVTRLDHAAYLGRELARAERSLETGEPYHQDQAPGALAASPKPSCGCSSCG